MLKLKEDFKDRIKSGQKRFEIRYNDRDYQVGDRVLFKPVDKTFAYNDLLNEFKITYILSGWGLEDGYVVFGIEPIIKEPAGE